LLRIEQIRHANRKERFNKPPNGQIDLIIIAIL